ncbi:DUF1232 domain-containing protein [uncultured Hymenobacter sp.]|uniref:DUF1232 domain-containing protein n=1 Tax=uncultured Hymenobacter sp. TaxID=170016 RepID=UPI0035C9C7B1
MDPRNPSGNDVAASALFKKFLGKAEAYIQQPTRLKQLLTDAYQKASEKNEVGTLAHEAWTTLQSLFRLVRAAASGEYTGVPGTTIAAAVAVFIYFLSPIDLIPDFIPVLGMLDDVALVAWFSTTIKHELEKFADWETSSAAVVEDHRPAAQPAASGAYSPTDKETQASTFAAASTATASSGNYAKHRADALDEQGEAAPDADNMTAGNKSGGTTALSDSDRDRAQPASQSAKNAGTIDLPSAPALSCQSATDAGLGSPSSSTSAPVHNAGPDVRPSSPNGGGGDDTFNTSGSREGSRTGGMDAGGNVR